MKRANTADAMMIEEINTLRMNGIKDFILTTTTDNKTFKPVWRHTAHGISAYANDQYKKYGDTTAVEVGYFDADLNYVNYCTYHA